MRHFTAIVLAILALSILAPHAASQDKDIPTAILLSCSGEVIVERNSGGRVPGSFGLVLFTGDEVKTSADSQAEIHFENGIVHEDLKCSGRTDHSVPIASSITSRRSG